MADIQRDAKPASIWIGGLTCGEHHFQVTYHILCIYPFHLLNVFFFPVLLSGLSAVPWHLLLPVPLPHKYLPGITVVCIAVVCIEDFITALG